jgi:hypothetical protein
MKFYGTRTASMIASGSNRRPHPCKGCVITTTLRKYCMQNIWAKWFLHTSKVVFSDTRIEILSCRILFWAGFSRNGSERQFVSLFVTWNGIPSCFLFRWRVRKGILRVCFYFCFHGMEFRVVRNSRNSVGNNHLFRLFRLRNYFFVKNSQP